MNSKDRPTLPEFRRVSHAKCKLLLFIFPFLRQGSLGLDQAKFGEWYLYNFIVCVALVVLNPSCKSLNPIESLVRSYGIPALSV